MDLRLLGLRFAVFLFFVAILQRKFHGWKKAGLVLLTVMLMVYMAVEYHFPVYPAPEPSGKLNVLTDTVYYRYQTGIPEMRTHGNEREVPVKIWYPENPGAHSHPLFLYSPGSFGGGEGNETLFLELASQGYIVMGLDHPYHTYISETSDGKDILMSFDFIKSVMMSQGSEDLEGTWASFKEWLPVRIDDLNYVLSNVLDLHSGNKYENYIDKTQIVLSGHSLGGSAVLAIGREKHDYIRAMIILEAPFAGDIIGIEGDEYVFVKEDYPLPVLHIYSDSLFDKIDEITTYDMNTRMMKSNNQLYVNKHISGVGHIGLTDMARISPNITNAIDLGCNTRFPPETLLEINDYVLDFLEGYVK